jgi:hypothetical protein
MARREGKRITSQHVGIVRAEATVNNIVKSGRLEISGPSAAIEHEIQSENKREPIRDGIREFYVLTYRILTAPRTYFERLL